MSAPHSARGISLRGVRFGYARRSRWRWLGGDQPPLALQCEALDVGPGLTLVLGPNGAGKSTLLKLVAGIEAPDCGVVTIDGRDLWREERAARQSLAYVPELPDLSPYAALGEVTRLVSSLRGVGPADGERALAKVGLDGLAWRSIREVSIGQRRRALLAAAFIGEPTTLLLDEPLESLDREMRDGLVAWLRGRLDAGATALVSTHEIEPFIPLVNTVVVMKAGAPSIHAPDPDPVRRAVQLDAMARGLGIPAEG